jgi:homopolymeric O-antigen transport system ATP-binding protein
VSRVVIRTERLSKQFRIGVHLERHPTLRDAVAAWPSRLAAHARGLRGTIRDDGGGAIWALRDVSLDIAEGEAVALIGRNGAGKTTLLKLFSRITEPTEGRVLLKGRVGSLLEVGTGFHPELTGRENIYLSGSILGLRRSEIDHRFSDIVEFSEVEQFLDTPIKRYSTGMQVRLAFAVAAHLEPEILLVDEVLAVGDVAFQRKCLGRMGEVAREGRTVVFVSHNMAIIQALCRRGIVLDGGQVVEDGPVSAAVETYLRGLEQAMSQDLRSRTDRSGWQEILVERIEISSPSDDGGPAPLVTGRPARFVFLTTGSRPSMALTFTVLNHLGNPVARLSSSIGSPRDDRGAASPNRFVCELDELLLVPGRYRIDLELRARGVIQDSIEGAAVFDVEDGTVDGRPVAAGDARGDVFLHHRWSTPGG